MPKRKINTLEELEAKLGDDQQTRCLIDDLIPIVQARIARKLLRYRASASATELRQILEDITQEVFVALFDNRARALRGWDPERGLSLDNFVGLIAERQAASILRTGKRSPWTEEPMVFDDLERKANQNGPGLDSPQMRQSPEQRVVSKNDLEYLWYRLQEELTPLGRRLFELLFIDDNSASDVCSKMKMTPDAVYAWRSRLMRRAREIMAETVSDTPVPSQTTNLTG